FYQRLPSAPTSTLFPYTTLFRSYIVVENDQAARNGIKWLKQENKGRATFLPLQSISPKNIPSRLALHLEEQPGFVGIAADLIETDKVYDRLKFYLLGNVI